MPSGTSKVMPPLSSCPGLATYGQLSLALHVPSASPSGAGVPAQVPALQTSPSVQISASLHDVPFSGVGSKTQPLAGLQLSAVQAFESLQTTVPPPTQAPALHTSAVVQTFPSLQLAPFCGAGLNAHPVAGLQLSAVQGCASWRTAALPPTQGPALRVSAVVQ